MSHRTGRRDSFCFQLWADRIFWFSNKGDGDKNTSNSKDSTGYHLLATIWSAVHKSLYVSQQLCELGISRPFYREGNWDWGEEILRHTVSKDRSRTSNTYLFYRPHHLSFNCVSVITQRLRVPVTLQGSGLDPWHCTLCWECWGCLKPSPSPLPKEFLGEAGGRDTIGNFICFYELSVTESTCVFACSGNTGVWCVTCFLLKL